MIGRCIQIIWRDNVSKKMLRFQGLTGFLPALSASVVLSSRRVATSSASDQEQFDLIVVGAGSGGMACAKRSASYGAKVAIVEGSRYGGTCVNVGCVPKKVMFNASHVNEVIETAHNFGFSVKEKDFDWGALKASRDFYISRLNKIYESGLDSAKISRIPGYGSFVDKNTIKVGSSVYKGKHIVLAPGGAPNKLGVPGEEYVIDSDGFFQLESQPKRVAVIGAGYIAVELAGVFNGLGSDTSLFVRGATALRNFDSMISGFLDSSMKKSGIKVNSGAIIASIVKADDGSLTVNLKDGKSFGPFDVVLAATGRHPLTAPLALENAGVSLTASGHITVDDYQNTSAKGVYALGDVCGKIELTPMAIAAGRRLGDRLFGGMPTAKADYTNVPTVVFSHPVIGTIGLTEEQARLEYKPEELKVYNSTFVNLWYGTYFKGGVGDKPLTKYKLICLGPEEKVIGLHCIGLASDEVLQGFGVAMKMGATKADFDSCIAIHPTAAEEFVTLPPWGLSGTGDKAK